MNAKAELTKREHQIAKLIAWGATKKDVANKLHIAYCTVETHVKNIFAKTGCTKANELSAWYFCTEFKISLQLSPFARKSVAVALITLFSYGELVESHNYLRARRCRVLTERTCRTRLRREDYPLVS